jgi:hypothetical protein
LDASLCWTGGVEMRRQGPLLTFVLAFEPQNYRPTTGPSSWALMLLSSPSSCDESLVDADRRAMERFAGDIGCAAAPPRAAPLASRQSRRADMVRPRMLRRGCGPRTPPRALDLVVGQSTCTCSRPRRAGAPGQSMPLSSPSPHEKIVVCELGFDPSLTACRC